MRVHSPYGCDNVVANLKGETNHWWLRIRRTDEEQDSKAALGARRMAGSFKPVMSKLVRSLARRKGY